MVWRLDSGGRAAGASGGLPVFTEEEDDEDEGFQLYKYLHKYIFPWLDHEAAHEEPPGAGESVRWNTKDILLILTCSC